jgi:cystathionine beta-lyase family protein involved in aluminum resistance
MQTVIGYDNPSPGSLKEFGIKYKELPMEEGKVVVDNINHIVSKDTKLALIQRSRGYSMRNPLSIEDIKEITAEVHRINPDCICFVDNCYGEFVDVLEPTQVGADIMAGSLIKNPGGGIAPTGGYIAGKDKLVELASYRLTAPGMGDELGASLSNNRLLFQGLFLAPHVVSQAIKGAIFAAGMFAKLGYKTLPLPEDVRGDIIQAIELGSAEKLIAFCGGIQKYSPVDSFATPVPWDMPGYADQVIMAAGTFVQGASIEFSADGPLRAPYNVYLQGGLTFEHAVIGIMGAAQAIEDLQG